MKEIIYFTLVSNKYLAHAKTLFKSLSAFNTSHIFIIGLVDEIIPDHNFYGEFNILPISMIEINDLPEMKKKYNVIELLTSVKPFYFNFLMKKYPNHHTFVYIDADCKFYNSIEEIIYSNQDKSLILTPHFFTPQPDDILSPSDSSVLRTGIFNLGFICINRSEESLKFIKWWSKKLTNYCFDNTKKGYFVDQIWVNFAPALARNCLVINHLGLNVSNWNLHERRISKSNGVYYINEDEKLIFYHFSNFNIDEHYHLATYNNRYNFDNRPEMLPLFEEYRQDLIDNGYIIYKNIGWAYQNEKLNKYQQYFEKAKKIIQKFIKSQISAFSNVK